MSFPIYSEVPVPADVKDPQYGNVIFAALSAGYAADSVSGHSVISAGTVPWCAFVRIVESSGPSYDELLLRIQQLGGSTSERARELFGVLGKIVVVDGPNESNFNSNQTAKTSIETAK